MYENFLKNDKNYRIIYYVLKHNYLAIFDMRENCVFSLAIYFVKMVL